MYQDSKTPGRVDGEWLAGTNNQPQSQIDNRENPKYYKPFVLWTSSLSFLLGITIILIAITEMACQRLPNAENRGIVGSLNNRTEIMSNLIARQNVPTQISNTQAPAITQPSSTFGQDGPATAVYSVSTLITKSDGIDITIEYNLQLTGPTTTEAQASVARVTTMTIVEMSTMIMAPGSFRIMTNSRTTTQNVPAQTGAGGPAQSVWATLGTKIFYPKQANAATPAPAPNQVPGQEPAKNTDFGIKSIGQPTVNQQPTAPVVIPATFIAVATTIIDTLGKAIITSVPVALDSSGSTIVIPSGLISADATTTFLLKPGTTATSGSANGTKSGGQDNTGAVIHSFTLTDYVTGSFVPTMLAVLFLIPWALIDTSAKQMEPIYQLAEAGGASAINSLALNYVTLSMFIVPFRAISRKHWVIALTSILMLLSLVTPPLAVESIFINLTGTCNADTGNDQCFPTLSVYKTAAHVLESVLAVMAFLLAILIYITRKRCSKVNAEPVSLAGVASLMQNQEFLNIIRELPFRGTKERDLINYLPPHSYKIGHYQNADGTWGYGFMLARDNSSPNVPYMNSNTYTSTNVNLIHNNDVDSINDKTANSWNRFSRVFQVLGFAFLLVGLLIMIIYYFFFKTSVKVGFGKFMSSQKFGVKFLFTALGVIIAQFWAYAREMIHRNEPYHNLQKGSSPPQSSLLISPSLAPITSLFTSLRRFAPLLILLDFSTLLADVLIITLSNIPYSPATTFYAWTVCSYISLAILLFMLFTLLVVLVRIGRFGSSGQDVPNTIVGKAGLMCGSWMLERFEGLGSMEGGERRGRILGWRERFGVGRVRGVDGVVRRGVDFEGSIEGFGGSGR